MKRLLAILILLLFPGLLYGEHLRFHKQKFFPPERTFFSFRPGFYSGALFPFKRLYSPLPPRYCPPLIDRSYPSDSTEHSRKVHRVVINSPSGMEIVQANMSNLIFKVSPERSMVFIDGRLIGSARDFSTERNKYTLVEGEHRLRIEFPGYQSFETRMQVVPNRTLHLDIELERDAR